MTARLERHEQRAAARSVAGSGQSVNFGVRLTGPRMPPVTDDDTRRIDHNRADHGIGCGPPLSACGVNQSTSHQIGIGYHFS